MEKLTWTVFEAAQALGIHPLTLRRAIARGEIQAVKVGKRVLVPKAALEALLGAGGDVGEVGRVRQGRQGRQTASK